MSLRILACSLFSFVLGVAFFTAARPANSSIEKDAVTNIQDDRAADREAIRAHIDSIFQAFIKKDAAALRATHAPNWLGYLEGSRTMLRGVDGYMDNVYVDPKSPYGMMSYKMREFDMILCSTSHNIPYVVFVLMWPSMTKALQMRISAALNLT